MQEMLKYIAAPILSPAVGALVTMRLRPSEWAQSVIQHAAAGLVFAAATVEMLPVLVRAKHPLAASVGFSLAILFLLIVRSRFRARKDEVAKKGVRKTTIVPLATAVGIDASVDGLLVGLGFAIGEAEGKLLLLAMTFENMFVGMALTSSSMEKKIDKKVTFFMTASSGIFFAIAAISGFLVVSVLEGALHQALLAFGIAAILYLVTEELLVKVHKNADTALETSAFFVGFLVILILSLA